MKERILVHIRAEGECISLRTISRSRKSPHQFYILRDRLEELEKKGQVIAHDINSFAVLRRDAGKLEITFTWLDKVEDKLTGYQEMLFLPYDGLSAFLRDSAEDGPKEWKALSMDIQKQRTKIVFKSQKNLRAVLANGIIRRKLIRFMRDQFQWPYSERVEIYDDYPLYSFCFQEFRKGGTPGISGGLILHGQEDLKNAYYSIHT